MVPSVPGKRKAPPAVRFFYPVAIKSHINMCDLTGSFTRRRCRCIPAERRAQSRPKGRCDGWKLHLSARSAVSRRT